MSKVTLKVVLIGDSGVGKSTLVNRYIQDTFHPHFLTTIGVQFAMKQQFVQGQNIKLMLWDSAGDFRYNITKSSLLAGSDIILFCYDIQNRQSFDHVPLWYNQAMNYLREKMPSSILVALKADDNSMKISSHQGQALAVQLGSGYIQVSSKTGQNVQKLFRQVSQIGLTRQQLQGGRQISNYRNIVQPPKCWCCC